MSTQLQINTRPWSRVVIITTVSSMKGWEYLAPVVQINTKCWLQATGAHRQKSYRNKTNICSHQPLHDKKHNLSQTCHNDEANLTSTKLPQS